MTVSKPTNGYLLLSIILDHAPDAQAQALVSRKYNEICFAIQKDLEADWALEIEKVMAGILHDGLKYGNWPWALQHSEKEAKGHYQHGQMSRNFRAA